MKLVQKNIYINQIITSFLKAVVVQDIEHPVKDLDLCEEFDVIDEEMQSFVDSKNNINPVTSDVQEAINILCDKYIARGYDAQAMYEYIINDINKAMENE